MKSVICLSLVLTVCVFADEAADRLAIEKLIVSLNQPQEQRSAKTVTALFAPHADPTEVARLSDMVRQMDDLRRPWLELNTPRLTRRPNPIRHTRSRPRGRHIRTVWFGDAGDTRPVRHDQARCRLAHRRLPCRQIRHPENQTQITQTMHNPAQPNTPAHILRTEPNSSASPQPARG